VTQTAENFLDLKRKKMTQIEYTRNMLNKILESNANI
jgi:hypothetical protein